MWALVRASCPRSLHTGSLMGLLLLATATARADETTPAQKNEPPAKPTPPAASIPPLLPEDTASGFWFGSYGRMVAATDLRGQPGRDSNIVSHGSRLDEGNYVELEFRRDDYWKLTRTRTRLVATLGIEAPVFHTTGNFNINMAVRNLYIEGNGFLGRRLSVWAGSRMYRGDDIYLLDWWPLDNLNTIGAGARYDISPKTFVAAHYGVNQPASDFYLQPEARPFPYSQPGSASVNILNRQKTIFSLKASHTVHLGETGGIKAVGYGEVHELAAGQRQGPTAGVYDTLPADSGWVIGGELGAFTGKRNTHVDLFVRYATGLAAYGEWGTPTDLAQGGTSQGAHEFLAALGGNYEFGPVGLMVGAYLRSFRNASPTLNFDDVDEGIVAVRPHLFIGNIGGVALEGSYQAQVRGTIAQNPEGSLGAGPLVARLFRFGVIPFLSPAGRGDYSRPQFRLIYSVSVRDQGAQSLYPHDDVFSLRNVEHFSGSAPSGGSTPQVMVVSAPWEARRGSAETNAWGLYSIVALPTGGCTGVGIHRLHAAR